MQTMSGSQFTPYQIQSVLDLGGALFPSREIVTGITPFRSNLIAVTGISTGDEGKGRTIPDAARILRAATGRPDVVGLVFKVNGGANSGHTADGLKLNLLPAGVGDPHIPRLGIGRGVVADPLKFIWEGRPLEAAGHAVFNRLLIDHRAMVSDITHRILDKVQEAQREVPRGSTGRGISPSYIDEVGQYVVHYADFLESRPEFERKLLERIRRAEGLAAACTRVAPDRWRSFFEELTSAELKANKESIDREIFSSDAFDLTRFCGPKPFSFNEQAIVESYWEAGQQLADCVGSVADRILECQEKGQYVFGEFGQAYWLDKRHGFSPNVTASHTYTPEFFQSGNIPAQPIHTIGVCKGYDTKVGTHLFLTEFGDEHPLGRALRMIEFGTTTGRQRMVGWYDAVEKGHVLRHGGFEEIVINKIDVLTQTPELAAEWDGVLKVCSAYRLPDGQVTRRMPQSDSVRRGCQPIYAECPSWSEDISGVRTFADLPRNAQQYVATVYRATIEAAYDETWRSRDLPPVRLIGVGPDSSQVILDAPAPGRLMAMGGVLR
jgi:adenylosuccinate synthase